MAQDPADVTGVAVAFVTALTKRDYAGAYGMTTRDYRNRVSFEAMQAAFEGIVPPDFGPIGSVESGLAMDTWPDKQPADQGWVYVSVGGDVFSEAVNVVVATEDRAMKVRDAEFGRP